MTVYWLPKLRKQVKDYIANNIPKNKISFDTIHIDHSGPLENTDHGNKYILSVIDAFTKFIKLYACKSTKTEEVVKHLNDYFRYYSKPKRIISDRGTCFTSKTFSEFIDGKDVKRSLIAVGTPGANGQVERFNRDITPKLAKLCVCPKKWDRILAELEYSINNTICRSTHETPSSLLFGLNQLGKSNDKIGKFLEENNCNLIEKLCRFKIGKMTVVELSEY